MNLRSLIWFGFCATCASSVGCAPAEDFVAEEEYERLDAFVDAALREEITPEETQATYESLDEGQREVVRRLLEEKTSLSMDQVVHTAPSETPAPEPLAAGAVWQQQIENVWTYNYPAKVFASTSYVDWNCDDDPTDKEYVFYYPYPSVSPSSLRWTSTSSQVYLAFILAYGGNLLGFGYNNFEARLCIGDTGVLAAGGAAKVKSNVFVHY